MNHYQAVAAEIDAKRKAQPIANALLDLLRQAADNATGAAREALEIRAIGISAHCARTWQDITDAEALAEIVAAGLAPEGAEPYAVFVDGQPAGSILARNRYHAANKARKEFGLHVVEVRGREVHGARFAPGSEAEAEALFARIKRIDANAAVPPSAPVKAPCVAGVERREHPSWPVRATCACGWLGIWHRTEPQTRVSARAHREAYGLLA